MTIFMDGSAEELHDEKAALEAGKAVDAVAADILRHVADYPAGNPVHEIPRIAAAMEKSIKRGKLEDARLRAGTLGQYLERYAPADEPAREAKYVLRHRVRLLIQSAP